MRVRRRTKALLLLATFSCVAALTYAALASRILMSDLQLGEALTHATQNKKYGEMEALLKAGADVNFRFDGADTPLHFAANAGDVTAIKLLLAHGADPSLRSEGKKPSDTAMDPKTRNLLLEAEVARSIQTREKTMPQ